MRSDFQAVTPTMPATAMPRPPWASIVPHAARGRPRARRQLSAAGAVKSFTRQAISDSAPTTSQTAAAMPMGASHGPSLTTP
jgi:hypothetical protein